MPLKKLKDFLDENEVKYTTVSHSKAYTAQQVANSAHVEGKDMAKTVMINIDGKMAMAVLPASLRVDLDGLARATGSSDSRLATEDEFAGLFPGCELGAMPPFGNLFGMKVFVSNSLAEDDEICFNAGTHTELLRLAYKDFERLVQPTVISFSKRAA